MLIGVPKEIKPDEYRIGLTPESVQALTEANHEVMVLTNAGLGIGKTDEEFKKIFLIDDYVRALPTGASKVTEMG